MRTLRLSLGAADQAVAGDVPKLQDPGVADAEGVEVTKREQTVLDGVQASLGQMIDTETAFIREPRRQTIPALVQAALDRRDTFQSLHRQVAALSADAALSTRAVEHTKQLLGDGDVNAG